MEMVWFKVLTIYGPLALGWIAYGWSEWKRQQLQEKFHEAICASTKVTERLAVLIEERTRRQ